MTGLVKLRRRSSALQEKFTELSTIATSPITSVQGVQENPERSAQPHPLIMNIHKSNPPLFRLGDIYITPGAQAELAAHGINPATLLERHVTGDWNDLPPVDARANREAIIGGARIFSSYHITPKIRIWLITEAGQESTTLLTPQDY